MMSILDLPPEILLEIFSQTLPKSPSLGFYSDYLQRNQLLLPLCLVHPRWTRQAQELLQREVWVQAYEAEEKEMEEKGRQLPARATNYLSVEGNIGALLKGSGFEKWKGVILLQSRQLDPNVEPTNFEDFARFPSLKTLVLLDGSYKLRSFDSNLSFANLRRLILGHCPQFVDDMKTVQSVLTPAHMPNLVHLGVQCVEHEVFTSILPQLETLAILDGLEGVNAEEGAALFRQIGRLGTNLKHLSVSIRRFDFEAFLFGEAAGLKLESLHIDTTSFEYGRIFREISPRFSAVVKGEEETIKINRIVIYQPPLESGRREEWMYNSDLDWRDEDGRAAFEYFNGT